MQKSTHITNAKSECNFFEFDDKVFSRSELEPYLFNIFLKRLSEEMKLPVKEVMQDLDLKKEIGKSVELEINNLEPNCITKSDYDRRKSEDNQRRNKALKAKAQGKLSEPDSEGKKSSFTPPNEDDAIYDEDNLDRDYTQLYGKLGVGDAEIPGSKLLACLNKPDSIPSKHREKFIRYRNSKTAALQKELSEIEPNLYNKSSRKKLYLISLLLSERGISPRWREYKRVYVKKADIEGDSSPELIYLIDVQLFDLEWMRRNYPNHKPSKRMNGLYRALIDSKDFDFNHAYLVASSSFTTKEKAKQLKLTETMQLDNFIIRNKTVDQRVKKLENDIDEVCTDLLEASQRNRQRGVKLQREIPERLNIWLSAQLTPGNSISLMCERYFKITGKKITPSSFRKKFRRTQAALLEVNSKHFISDMANF